MGMKDMRIMNLIKFDALLKLGVFLKLDCAESRNERNRG